MNKYSYSYIDKDGETYPGGVFYAKSDDEAREIVKTLQSPENETIIFDGKIT